MTLELDIVSLGMVTAVGLDAPSACAAMRARVWRHMSAHTVQSRSSLLGSLRLRTGKSGNQGLPVGWPIGW